MKYSKKQVKEGLKIIKNNELSEEIWNKICFKLMDMGFTVSNLKDHVMRYDKKNISIYQKSLLGDYGGALNMIYNYMTSYLGAQYVREQFLDLIENYMITL